MIRTHQRIDIKTKARSKFQKRLNTARQHAWDRWHKEYIHSLMESHRIIKGDGQLPNFREVVLVLGDEKNCRLCKKAKVLRLIGGMDGVVRGHKGHEIERSIQLICPLEMLREVARKPEIATPQVEEKREANQTCSGRCQRKNQTLLGRRGLAVSN